MGKLIVGDNFVVVEYETTQNKAEYDLKENGKLFVFGYEYNFMNKKVGGAKSWDIGRKDLKVAGLLSKMIKVLSAQTQEAILSQGIDPKRSVLLIEKQRI